MKLQITVSDADRNYSYSTDDITLSKALIFATRVILGMALEGEMATEDIVAQLNEAQAVTRRIIVMEEKNE